jgi:hypothetical protein
MTIPVVSDRVMIVGLVGHGKAKRPAAKALDGPPGPIEVGLSSFEIRYLDWRKTQNLPTRDEKV